MEQEKITRINVLAKKAKEEGLTEAEKTEQQQLRREYIDAMKANLRAQLENVVVVDADGKETKLEKKSAEELAREQAQGDAHRHHHDHGQHPGHCGCGCDCEESHYQH